MGLSSILASQGGVVTHPASNMPQKQHRLTPCSPVMVQTVLQAASPYGAMVSAGVLLPLLHRSCCSRGETGCEASCFCSRAHLKDVDKDNRHGAV